MDNLILSTPKRNGHIDLLRGLSILSVILLHCFIQMPLTNDFLSPKLFNLIFRSGYYGVIVFFVISGFLITNTSIKRFGTLQNISPRQFYLIRFARIMPCLIALLLTLSLLDLIGIQGFVIKNTSLFQALFSAISFQLNWLEAKTGYLPANWDILWSLSVEEMFYLFFPLFCLIFRKLSYLFGILLLFVIMGPVARTVIHNEIWSDHSYLSCMDGIAIGCLAALMVHYFKLTKRQTLLILFFGVSCFLFIFIFRKQAYDLGLSKFGLNVTLLEIGMGLILIALHTGYRKEKHLKSFFSQLLCWLGRNSYEIYLIHCFCILAIANTLFNSKQSTPSILTWYTLAIIGSGTAGQFISSNFSEPINKLIRIYGDGPGRTPAPFKQ